MDLKTLTEIKLGFSTKAVYSVAKGVLGFLLVGNILFSTLSHEEWRFFPMKFFTLYCTRFSVLLKIVFSCVEYEPLRTSNMNTVLQDFLDSAKC